RSLSGPISNGAADGDVRARLQIPPDSVLWGFYPTYGPILVRHIRAIEKNDIISGFVKKEIRILYVEDLPAEVVMVNHELRLGGLAFRTKRVETRDAFIHELEQNTPDVILCDHGLPSFDGFTALAIARDKCPEIPFIFVTGSLGEQMAIEAFENGATDYVLKSRLARLVPVVQRALREAHERSTLREKEQALHESEERFRMLIESVKDYAIFMLD